MKYFNLLVHSQFTSIFIGFIASFIIAILIVEELPFHMSEYLPLFIGAFLACLISAEKPLVTGVLIAFLMMLSSYATLVIIVNSMSQEFVLPRMTFKIVIQYLFYFPFGILGSYSGYLLKAGRMGTAHHK